MCTMLAVSLSVLGRCWLNDGKGVWPVKKLSNLQQFFSVSSRDLDLDVDNSRQEPEAISATWRNLQHLENEAS